MAATVSVGTAPVLVFAPQQYSLTATLTNNGTTTLYLGQSGVTAATGLPLYPRQSLNATFNVDVYAVAAIGATTSPTTTLTADASASDTALTVASGTAFTLGKVITIEDGSNSEVVTETANGTSTGLTVTALQFDHASGTVLATFAGGSGGSIQVHAQGV